MQPERTTTASIGAVNRAVHEICSAAQSLGALDVGVAENDDGATAIVTCTFEARDAAERYSRTLEHGGLRPVLRLTREAVLSWIGYRGAVKCSSEPYGVSLCLTGAIEQIDDDTIRVVPRALIGGFDLGPSSFGGKIGDIPIRDVVDITPV